MHEKHRQRMKERFLRSGGDGFAPHELLEMILYYSNPRGNTNPTAHELLERFGSIKGVLEAPVDELIEVNGVGMHTAVLLHLIPELMRRCARDGEKRGTIYSTLSKIGTYIYPRFIGVDQEKLYMMLFNNRMEMLDCILISDGVVNVSEVPARKMIELCIRKKAANVVIAHNHPDGMAYPSENDLSVTMSFYETFRSIGINLIEHLVISGNHFWPIIKRNCQLFDTVNTLKSAGVVEKVFYDGSPEEDGSYKIDD